jgi:hypothetical protein
MASDYKKIYDDLAVAYFKSLGLNSVTISSTPCADVLATSDHTVSIAEVKSSKEPDSRPTYWPKLADDLLPELRAKHGAYFRTMPLRLGELIESMVPLGLGELTGYRSFADYRGFVCLYVLATAFQLYRYFVEFEGQAGKYEKFTRPVALRGRPLTRLPVLLIPRKYERALERANDILTEEKIIAASRIATTPELAVLDFCYSVGTPSLG